MRGREVAAASEYGATIKCTSCTIFIGEGHEEQTPLRGPEGQTYLCSACYQAALRRAQRTAE